MFQHETAMGVRTSNMLKYLLLIKCGPLDNRCKRESQPCLESSTDLERKLALPALSVQMLNSSLREESHPFGKTLPKSYYPIKCLRHLRVAFRFALIILLKIL